MSEKIFEANGIRVFTKRGIQILGAVASNLNIVI